MITFLGGERKHTIKKNTEALLAASKEIGLHVRGKVKFSRYRPGVAQRVGKCIALLFHDCGTRRG